MIKYNPETGQFHRQLKSGAYKEAGFIDNNGYVYISLNGTKRIAHRLAFELMGEDLPEQVDHINQVRHDNRWCNLRPATRSENMWNAGKSRNNTTGVRGVYRHRDGYQAKVQHMGKRYTKSFRTVADASDWATNKRNALHGEFVCHA